MTDNDTQQIRVWDPLIRLFHWTLVIGFLVAYLSGDELLQIHLYAGYLITGLLVFRIVWGFIGSRHARFADFIYPPREIVAYLKSLGSGRPKRYLGHNPAGGVMVILLLLGLGLTVGTGLLMDDAAAVQAEGAALHTAAADQGRLIRVDADDDDDEAFGKEGGMAHEVLEELHEFFANFTLFLVFLHIAGVIVSSRLHGENLVRAMITGNKPAEPGA
ncbi:cytochrome b/b6 domain-containing protein [Thiohalobacter sp. IOR34]|uniref:cytochrome b/b6 domain-containing protein n=1 Tax=Thiohalobacter sp. IOR34 TaxID=3057176 RepID=UPI0025AF65CC|nr:cytochrome b/b6 domain-containing protein [Thiohalobacter sp. IOR34]WJW74304.1 cytochrome b/b6 domain-containing protein [Thiohalobacter sp. IOR34]